MNDQIERVLDLFEPQAEEQGVEIIRYLDPDLPSMLLDGETLQAALVNLVKNALEAMPDGGQLVARTRLTRTGVALDLIDTGCGMDDSTAMQMFEAFFTTKNGGSGLGLPTAARSSKPTAAASASTAKSAAARSSRWSFPRRAGWGSRGEWGGESGGRRKIKITIKRKIKNLSARKI